jgi:hypothetical protein
MAIISPAVLNKFADKASVGEDTATLRVPIRDAIHLAMAQEGFLLGPLSQCGTLAYCLKGIVVDPESGMDLELRVTIRPRREGGSRPQGVAVDLAIHRYTRMTFGRPEYLVHANALVLSSFQTKDHQVQETGALGTNFLKTEMRQVHWESDNGRPEPVEVASFEAFLTEFSRYLSARLAA